VAEMRIVIAPDSFKESLTAVEVADLIEEGIRRVFEDADIEKVPIADGGEGTVKAVISSTKGRTKEVEVTGPLGEKVVAEYGIIEDGETAIIEMAAASGLALIKDRSKRNPMITTTYGTGELIKDALGEGVRRIIVGIGGSATVDGGCGMAQALGVGFINGSGKEIGFGGGALKDLVRIDMSGLDPRIKDVEIIVASDVTNPLLGPQGAARVYGPQKGATPEMVEELERGLETLGAVIAKDIGIDVREMPGGGAAGGLGAGLVAFLGAKIRNGFELIAELCGLEDKIKSADLVVTGEGRMDRQTIKGKAPMGVAKMARKYGVPVIAICGSLAFEASLLYDRGIDAMDSSVTEPMTLEEAISRAPSLLIAAAERAMRMVRVGMGICSRLS
jgi:glycerate kinase